MSNTIPKFPKVAIIQIVDEGDSFSRINKTFENCGLMITGDYLIITTEKQDGTVGTVFKLKDVLEYKTYNK
jgi:hypothetical protein